MNRKVYDAGSNLGHAALMQGLGGSGSVNKDQAAQKLGLLTKAGGFLKTDEEGKIPVSSVSSKALMLVPVSPKKHYVDEKQVYHVPGMTALKVTGVPGGVTATVVDSNKLEVTSTSAGEKIFFINGVQVDVAIHAVELVAPILEKGKDRIVTVNQRSKTLILDIGNQPESLANNIVSVEWEVRDAVGTVIENLTSSGTAYTCVIPAEGQFRIIRARLNAPDGSKSPWSNSVMLDFYPLSAWIQDPLTGGARYGCFADQRIVVDSNFGREANIIDFTELDKENKDILRTIEKPSDSGTFMINPHEGLNGDIISVCYGDSSFVAENYLPWGFEGQLCVFNYNTDGYTKEQAASSENITSLKSSSRKAQKLPRLQKDGVFYKVDPTTLALSKNGSRIVGAVYGNTDWNEGRFSGIYTYKKLSTGSYIQEELISEVYSYDADVSEDGKTLLRFEGLDRKLLVVQRKNENNNSYSEEIIDFGISEAVFVLSSVRFSEDERYAVVYSTNGTEGRLYLVDIQNKNIVSVIPVVYSVTSLNQYGDSTHRIRASLDRKTFVLSTGISFTSFRLNFEDSVPQFEILRIGTGIDMNTARVSKIRSDGRVLLNICEASAPSHNVEFSGSSKFAHQYLDSLEIDENPIYPEYISSIYKRNDIPSGFIERGPYFRNSLDRRPSNEKETLDIVIYGYVNPTTMMMLFRFVTIDVSRGIIMDDVLLKHNSGVYFTIFNDGGDDPEINTSSNLDTITLFYGQTKTTQNKEGAFFIFRNSGTGYVSKDLPSLNYSGSFFRGTCPSDDGKHIFITHSAFQAQDQLQVYRLNSSGNYELSLNSPIYASYADVGIGIGICGDRDRTDVIDLGTMNYIGGPYSGIGKFLISRYNVSNNTLITASEISVDFGEFPFSYGYPGHTSSKSSNGRLISLGYASNYPIESMFLLEFTGSSLLKTYLFNFLTREELEGARAKSLIFFDPVKEDCFYTVFQKSGKWHLTNYRYVSQNNIERLSTKTLGLVRDSDIISPHQGHYTVCHNKLLIGTTGALFKDETYVFELD